MIRLLPRPQSAKNDKERFFVSLTLPVIILELVVSVFPIFYTITTSFTNESLRTTRVEFVGLFNYITALTDPDFWYALSRTVLFVVVSILLRIVGGIGLAYLLNAKLRGRTVPRIAIMIPWVISEVMVAAIWLWALDHQAGLINAFLSYFDVKPTAWLAKPGLAMVSIIMVMLWKNIAFSFLLYLGAIQKIPQDLYDASKIDGATSYQSFRYITLQLLRPTIMLNVIMVSVSCINAFSLVYSLTGGGPLYATELIGLYVYRQSFLNLNMGYGAALATILFVFNLVLTWIYYRALKLEELV